MQQLPSIKKPDYYELETEVIVYGLRFDENTEKIIYSVPDIKGNPQIFIKEPKQEIKIIPIKINPGSKKLFEKYQDGIMNFPEEGSVTLGVFNGQNRLGRHTRHILLHNNKDTITLEEMVFIDGQLVQDKETESEYRSYQNLGVDNYFFLCKHFISGKEAIRIYKTIEKESQNLRIL